MLQNTSQLNIPQKSELDQLCRDIQAIIQPYDHHLNYSLKKSITCQTFSALALQFLMRTHDQAGFLPANILEGHHSRFLDNLIANSNLSDADSTLQSSRQVLAKGFLKNNSTETIMNELKSKGMRTAPPLYVQAALGLLPLERLEEYRPS